MGLKPLILALFYRSKLLKHHNFEAKNQKIKKKLNDL
jgi:hypothetical protein